MTDYTQMIHCERFADWIGEFYGMKLSRLTNPIFTYYMLNF